MLFHKIKKLWVMPREEILFRIRERQLEKKEQRHHQSGSDQLSDADFLRTCCGLSSGENTNQVLFEQFWSKERDRFFTECFQKENRINDIKTHLNPPLWLDEADRICNGKLTLLGCETRLAENKGWHQDPLEGCEWPRVFYKDVTKSKPSPTVDIKYVWEMNRHQYLIVLGKAYWFTGDEKYAEKAFSIITSWIEDNPYHSGVNWTSSLELAVRSLSWIWTYFLCRDAACLTPEFHFRLLKSIYEHGLHMSQHLSYYSSPYNHLIGEAAGLHVIGSLFSPLKDGQKWESLGWSILENQVHKQFFEDGLCVEQATFYHHFTLGFYVQSALLRRVNNKAVSADVLSAVEKAFEVSMGMTRPDGALPAIGDIDNARSLYFSPKHSWDFRGMLSLGAALFQRPDFKRQSSGVSEELLWLSDDAMLAGFKKIEAAAPKGQAREFQDSGYYVMRNHWEKNGHYLCFDCGEIAAGLHEGGVPSAAHGHADALSFELSAYGKNILAEGGFYTYFGELAWHRYFREEAAHNTVQIGAHRQAEYCGRLTWKSVRNPQLNFWRCIKETQSVSGSVFYAKNVMHRRDIVFMASRFWVLLDQITSDGRGESATAYFHFDANVSLEIDRDRQQIKATNGDSGLLMQYFGDYNVDAQKGKPGPEGGWQASGYGDKTPVWVLSFELPLNRNPVLFPMLLLPWKAGETAFHLKSYDLDLLADEVLEIDFSYNMKDYVATCQAGSDLDVHFKNEEQ